MGLLGKTIGLASKAGEAVLDTANKKLNDAKKKKEEEERRFIEQFPYKYRYTVRQKDATSVDLVFWEILERDSYVVYDASDNPVYIAKGTAVMGKHHFIVTDKNRNVIGRVNKSLVNIRVPFEKESKSCSIEISGQEPFSMSTSVMFKERSYSISRRGLQLTADPRKKEFQIFENSGKSKSKKPIVHIYKVRSDEEFWHDKYYVGFDDEHNLLLAIFSTIGIDTIRYGSD